MNKGLEIVTKTNFSIILLIKFVSWQPALMNEIKPINMIILQDNNI